MLSFPDFRPQLSQFLPHDKGTEHIVAKRRGVEHPVQECRNNAVGAMNGLNLAPERVQEEFNLDCVGENDRVVVWFERFFDDRGRVIETGPPDRFFAHPETERARQFVQRYAGEAAWRQ